MIIFWLPNWCTDTDLLLQATYSLLKRSQTFAAKSGCGVNGRGSATVDAEAKGSFLTELNRPWAGTGTAASSFQDRAVTEQYRGR